MMKRNKILAIGLACAMASSIALFTGCSDTSSSDAAEASAQSTSTASTQSQAYTHAPLATAAPDAEPTLAASATATVGETRTGMIITSGSASKDASDTNARSGAASSTTTGTQQTTEASNTATDTEQTTEASSVKTAAKETAAAETTDNGTSTPYTMGDKGDYTTVKLGSDNAAVEALQDTLTDLGYLNGATGYFGTDTKTALEAFQAANHLTVDGIAGNSTWDVLLSGNAVEA